jgi:membrane fusion protein
VASLFRREVIEGRQQAWLGSIQLVRPVPLAVLTAIVVIIAAIVGAFLFEGRYTRKAHITGYLIPDRGVLRLVAPQPGIVAESHVVEGRLVHRGDVLFVLAVDRASLSGDTQAAVQSSLAARRRSLQDAARHETQLRQEQVSGIDRQITDMRVELAQLDADAHLHEKLIANKQEELEQFESMRDYVSAAHLRTKKSEVLDAQTKLQALRLKRATQQREIGVLEARRREAPLRSLAVAGEIEREIALLAGTAAENAAKQTIVIRAERDGIVTAVLAEPGQSVTPASALASLLPADAQLQAQLFAPSSAVGFVRPNQQVQLRYQAFPYQKFGHHAGQVLQVSRTPLQATELAGLPLPEAMKGAASAEPLYRITVALDQQAVQAYGQAQPLAAGMQLEADVLLDRRRLIEWIFEPLLSVTGRV